MVDDALQHKEETGLRVDELHSDLGHEEDGNVGVIDGPRTVREVHPVEAGRDFLWVEEADEVVHQHVPDDPTPVLGGYFSHRHPHSELVCDGVEAVRGSELTGGVGNMLLHSRGRRGSWIPGWKVIGHPHTGIYNVPQPPGESYRVTRRMCYCSWSCQFVWKG